MGSSPTPGTIYRLETFAFGMHLAGENSDRWENRGTLSQGDPEPRGGETVVASPSARTNVESRFASAR